MELYAFSKDKRTQPDRLNWDDRDRDLL
jgi:hypothetical protein